MDPRRNIIQKVVSLASPFIPFRLSIDLVSVRGYLEILSNKISEQYQPDIVIGIAYGGVYPAYEVSRHLGCEMSTIHISRNRYQLPVLKDIPGSFAFIKTFRKLWKDPGPILINIDDIKSESLEDKNLLVVDDDSASGETLKLGKRCLKRENPNDIKTAVILKHGKYKPDFFTVETNKGFVFSWRKISPYHEDFLKDMSRLGLRNEW